MAAPAVLLVDANEDCRLIYGAAFRHHGLSVLVLAAFEEAVEKARDERPQLIVLALTYSTGPGWEVLRRLKADPETACIPVVGLSTTGLAEHRERALALGCVAFLVKPLPPLELLNAVRRVLQAAPEVANSG